MTVYFISAGPGAPDLITLRAKSIIEKCNTILYAGSLIPEAVLEFGPHPEGKPRPKIALGYQHPKVELINAEGRSFLERTDERYDLIWFVAPDSYSAMNAA